MMTCTTHAPLVQNDWCSGATSAVVGLKATFTGNKNDAAPLMHHWCKTTGAVVQKVHRTSHLLVTGAVVHPRNTAPVDFKPPPGESHD